MISEISSWLWLPKNQGLTLSLVLNQPQAFIRMKGSICGLNKVYCSPHKQNINASTPFAVFSFVNSLNSSLETPILVLYFVIIRLISGGLY